VRRELGDARLRTCESLPVGRAGPRSLDPRQAWHRYWGGRPLAWLVSALYPEALDFRRKSGLSAESPAASRPWRLSVGERFYALVLSSSRTGRLLLW